MSNFAGIYYDGCSTRQTAVKLRVDEERGVLDILIGNDAPLAYLLSEVRITPRVASTPTSIVLPGGGLCEVAESATLDAAFRRARQARPGALIHTLQSRPQYVGACTALLLGLFVFSVCWGVPMVARRLADTLPPEVAAALGRGSLDTLDKLILKPSELPEARQQQLERAFLGMADDYPELPLRLHFRSGVPANAFALPDGSIVLTDGLVAAAARDQEIFAVLAHEIGHVKNRDGLRAVLGSTAMALLFTAYFADLTQLTALGAGLPTAFTEARFSRAQEADADAFALRYLQAARIQPYHMADMLRALQARMGAESQGPLQYLASHPPTLERVELFEQNSDTEPLVREVARLIKVKSRTEFQIERSLFDVVERARAGVVLLEVEDPQRGVCLFQREKAAAALRSEYTEQVVPQLGKPLAQVSAQEVDEMDEATFEVYDDHFGRYVRKRDALHAETLLGSLGFGPVDTITRINGVAVTTIESGKQALANAREAPALEIEVYRKDEPVRLVYYIEPPGEDEPAGVDTSAK